METKMLEVRDKGTFIPVLCIRPVAENESQRYLLRRDGYGADESERLVIIVKNQCSGCSYDPYRWPNRTMQYAHNYIEKNWQTLRDGDVVDVEYILGESTTKKRSECCDF